MEAATDGTSDQPNTVLVRVYSGIVKDYARRGVFPMLVPSGPLVQAGAVSCHVLADLAKLLLEDARVQHGRKFSREDRGQKKSYCSLIEALDRALYPEKWAKIEADADAARQKYLEELLRREEEQKTRTVAVPNATETTAGLDWACNVVARLRIEALEGPPSARTDGLWTDPGRGLAQARMEDTPAQFRVGQTVRYWSPWNKDSNDGKRLDVVGGYGLHRVIDDEGRFVTAPGDRVSYRWGYLAQARGGARMFYPAYMLQTIDYETSHVRLVPPVERREEQSKGA